MNNQKNEILLSIAIPTYNRDEYLYRCLSYLFAQCISQHSLIEIIVSDNGSTDKTFDVVSHFIKKGLNIQYIKNNENKGMDFNFSQCYLKSKGNYIVTFSDDDIFFPGAIEKILTIIKENKNYGVIHLNSKYISKIILGEELEIENISIPKVSISVYNNPLSILNRINHWVSYISGNIINKKFVNEKLLIDSSGTCIAHVPLILNAITLSKENVVVDTPLIGMQLGNSGGYNILKTFGFDFIRILENYDYKIKNIITNYIIFDSLPSCIHSLRSNSHQYIEEKKPELLLKDSFNNSLKFQLILYPLIKMPKLFVKLFIIFIKIFNYSRKAVLNLFYSKAIIRKKI